MTAKQTQGIFSDADSQHQIAIFRTHEVLAARDRNAEQAGHWNDRHRVQWELEHLGKAKDVSKT